MLVGRKAASALLAVCAVWLGGCGEGLGECNEATLGGDASAGIPYDGQDLVVKKCASSRCHSEQAIGSARVGAPANLNFDVTGSDEVALHRNIATVVDWAEDMWAEIEEGAMPPPPPAGSGELNSVDKEKVRNWLACGAPTIAGDATSTTWDGIWTSLSSKCVGCHTGTAAAGGGFVLGEDACSSYTSMVGKASLTASCGTRVVKNDPAGSLLYQKITGTQPMGCGTPMPRPPLPMLSDSDPMLVTRIEAWIMNGALPPAGCTPAP